MSVDLEGLHIFDDRPALVVSEANAEFMSAIAVAIRARSGLTESRSVVGC
jgi:hypothetical protein